jgi:hypothetical protein
MRCDQQMHCKAILYNIDRLKNKYHIIHEILLYIKNEMEEYFFS